MARIIVFLQHKRMPCPELGSYDRLEDLVLVGLHRHLAIIIAWNVILNQGTLEIVAYGSPTMEPSKVLLSRCLLFNHAVWAKPLLWPPKYPDLSLRPPAKMALVREPYPVQVLWLRVPL
jgi:hypothetical protein